MKKIIEVNRQLAGVEDFLWGEGTVTQIRGGKEVEVTRINAMEIPYGNITIAEAIAVSGTGNAGSATKLATARTIGGVSFDGTANINLPGVDAAGNQNTTGNSGTATKLATARTINGVAFDGSANIVIADSTKAPLASPELTGTPTAPTAAAATNTAQIATTAFVQANKPVINASTVGSAIVGMALGAVGSYAFLRGALATIHAGGATLAGSSLNYSDSLDTAPSGETAATGTWRCMGRMRNGGTAATLWLRIA